MDLHFLIWAEVALAADAARFEPDSRAWRARQHAVRILHDEVAEIRARQFRARL